MTESSLDVLGRGLLRLARTHATGTVLLSGRTGEGALHIRDGCPVALEAPAMRGRLGELLAVPCGPFDGSSLVDTGLATEAAVSSALRTQMRVRLARLVEDPGLRFRFVAAREVRAMEEPMEAVDLLLAIARVHEMPVQGALERLEGTTWRLADESLRNATLGPSEQAMVNVLRQGQQSGETLAAVGGGGLAPLRTLETWRRVGLVEAATSSGKSSVLLKKRQQLRRATSARRLLELSPEADAREARRAVRRLARDVHPDRFDAKLQAASHAVLKGILDAESTLDAQ